MPVLFLYVCGRRSGRSLEEYWSLGTTLIRQFKPLYRKEHKDGAKFAKISLRTLGVHLAFLAVNAFSWYLQNANFLKLTAMGTTERLVGSDIGYWLRLAG